MEWSETLLKMARPDIYRINAFRILNTSVTASLKEIHARIRNLDLMEKYANVESKDGSFLPVSIARDHGARHEALRRLLDPELRFIDEFFWFWPRSRDGNEDSDDAIQAVLRDDLTDALSIWRSREAQESEANVSVHNLAILHHAMALDIECLETRGNGVSKQQVEQKRTHWEEAFTRWKMLLNDERFWNRVQERVHDLDDPRLTENTARRIREGLPRVLLSISAMLAVEAAETDDLTDMTFHLMMMNHSGFDNAIIQEVTLRALTPTRNHLRAMCLRALEEMRDAPERGDKVASKLIDDVAPLLSSLDMLLPEGDSARESAHDEVALQVRSCLIEYLADTEDWRAASGIAKEALGIAESSSLRQKIKDDLETIGRNMEYATCWFCGRHDADSHSAAKVMMHGNVERERRFTGTQVRWQGLPVMVPRCMACKSAHGRQSNLRTGGVVTGIVLGVLLGIALQEIWHGVLVALVVFAAFGLGGYLISALTLPKETHPESHGRRFRTVREMLAKGWEIGEKPEGVS